MHSEAVARAAEIPTPKARAVPADRLTKVLRVVNEGVVFMTTPSLHISRPSCKINQPYEQKKIGQPPIHHARRFFGGWEDDDGAAVGGVVAGAGAPGGGGDERPGGGAGGYCAGGGSRYPGAGDRGRVFLLSERDAGGRAGAAGGGEAARRVYRGAGWELHGSGGDGEPAAAQRVWERFCDGSLCGAGGPVPGGAGAGVEGGGGNGERGRGVARKSDGGAETHGEAAAGAGEASTGGDGDHDGDGGGDRANRAR